MINVIDFFSQSYKNKRSENQDQYIFIRSKDLSSGKGEIVACAVLDGVSSLNGKQASGSVSHILHGLLHEIIIRILGMGYASDEQQETLILSSLKKAILVADKELCEKEFLNTNTNYKNRYGTTVSIAVLYEDKLFTANIGDSPIFLYNVTDINDIRYVEAYSCQNEAGIRIANGEITEDQATAYEKNHLLRYAGFGIDEKDIAIGWIRLPTMSMLLIGSDGALAVCDKEEVKAQIRSALDFKNPAEKLNNDLSNVIQRDTVSTDNYTLISALINCAQEGNL